MKEDRNATEDKYYQERNINVIQAGGNLYTTGLLPKEDEEDRIRLAYEKYFERISQLYQREFEHLDDWVDVHAIETKL